MANPWTFLVVVPTHRPNLSASTIQKLQDSLTYPTEFHVLDGTQGKVQTINEAVTKILDPSKHRVYCTVDDDLVMAENWQHFLACALDRVPKLGLCGIDLSGTKDGNDVMGAGFHAPIRRVADVGFRDTVGVQNVAGACMAIPSHIAKQIGPMPLSDDGRIYHLEEDTWRCNRCVSLGYRHGYVTNPNGPIELLEYENDPEYTAKKQADIKQWQQNPKLIATGEPFYPDSFRYFGVSVHQPPTIIECLAKLRDAEQPRVIFEIGTSDGGLTAILADLFPDARIHTFDVKPKPPSLTDRAVFRQWDVKEQHEAIGGMISSGQQALVLCDGGDKPWEFNTFAQYLKPGDMIMCHDFPSPRWRHIEVTEMEIAGAVEIHHLNPHLQELMNRAAWGSYRRRSD